MLGVGNGRKLGLWAIKQARRTSLSEEAVAQFKSSLPKRTQLQLHTCSRREISPVCWKSLPSTGIPEDQPQLGGVTCDPTPEEPSQAVLRLAVFVKQTL